MPPQNITRGNYRTLVFTVFGPGGPSASPPDLDTTTTATLGSTAPASFTADPDPSNNRRCFVSALQGAVAGATADITITARGHSATATVALVEPPDLSTVFTGSFSSESPLPHP